MLYIPRTVNFIEVNPSVYTPETPIDASLLELICLHEAAHAVVAIKLDCVNVDFKVMASRRWEGWIDGECWWNDKQCNLPKTYVRRLIDIAGYLAECLRLDQDPLEYEHKFFQKNSCFEGDARSVGKQAFKKYVTLCLEKYVQPNWSEILEAAVKCQELYVANAEGWAGLEIAA